MHTRFGKADAPCKGGYSIGMFNDLRLSYTPSLNVSTKRMLNPHVGTVVTSIKEVDSSVHDPL